MVYKHQDHAKSQKKKKKLIRIKALNNKGRMQGIR